MHIISDLAWCGCSIVTYLLSIKSCRNFNKENRLFFDAPGEYLPTWNMRTEPSSPHCKVPLRRKLSWVEEAAGAGSEGRQRVVFRKWACFLSPHLGPNNTRSHQRGGCRRRPDSSLIRPCGLFPGTLSALKHSKKELSFACSV